MGSIGLFGRRLAERQSLELRLGDSFVVSCRRLYQIIRKQTFGQQREANASIHIVINLNFGGRRKRRRLLRTKLFAALIKPPPDHYR
jgi:hypothetical protein